MNALRKELKCVIAWEFQHFPGDEGMPYDYMLYYIALRFAPKAGEGGLEWGTTTGSRGREPPAGCRGTPGCTIK